MYLGQAGQAIGVEMLANNNAVEMGGRSAG